MVDEKSEGENRFHCDRCYRSYKHASNLRRHVNYECKKRDVLPRFKCTICDYRSKRKSDVFKHTSKQHRSLKNSATDGNHIREYRCQFCDSPYSRRGQLKRHITRGCFKDPSFSLEERLSSNKKESRKYVCPTCSQGYKNKRTLATHLRIVCGQEPKFQCSYCDLKSKHPSNIYTHIRRKHKGEDLIIKTDDGQNLPKPDNLEIEN